VELAVLMGVGVLAALHVEAPNLTPLAPMGWRPFLPSMALIYISYVGFELITVASEEIVNPGKTIPRAILITLGVATAIYVFVIWAMMGSVHYAELAESDVPFIFTAERLMGPWGKWAGITATIMASLSAFSVTLGASARVLYALGRDGHFPAMFARLNHRFQTPDLALFVCSLVVIGFASSGIVRFVASLSDFGYLMGLGIVNYAVISLQVRMPNLRRPFKVALFPLVPILGMITCWMFVPALEARSFVLGGILTIIGGAIYLSRPANRAELAGLPEAWSKMMLLLRAKWRRRMKVLIISGGRLGRSIADRLLARDELRMVFRQAEHQITFVEPDESLCQLLEERYGVPIYQGDGTRKDLLEQVGVENVDIAIAASEDQERNVIAALQAKRLGIDQVIGIVEQPDYVALLEEQGVVAISAPGATAAMVENYLDRPGVAELFGIGTGIASLVSVRISQAAKVAGRLIKDIEMPLECVVAAVIRGKDFVVPRGKTEILPNDNVILVGPAHAVKRAREIFCETA
jgi:Trk K+ transport system NAD-binding subunit